MCGGAVVELLDDAGKAVEKNVTQPVVGAVDDAGKAIQENIIDPVKEFGSSLEKAVRDAADDVNKVIENPYVQMIVTAINPAAGAVVSAYATLNSGQELSAGQIAALATAGITQGNIKITPEVQKAINVGTTVADGGSVEKALFSAYGSEFAKELGLDTKVQSGLSNVVGSDFAQKITSNIDVNRAAADYVAGVSPERILANQFGDDVVSYLGAETPVQQAFGYAGIETALQKAEGASDEDALLAGAKTYYNRGGTLPDVNQIASLAGFDELPDFDINSLIPELNLDLSTVRRLGFDFPSLSQYGFDLNRFNLQAPDIFGSGLELRELADLGVDFGKVDFSGAKLPEFGDYSLPELKNLGVNLGDLNLDLELGSLGIAVLGEQQRQQLQEQEKEEDLLDGTLAFQSEFDVPLDEPSFAREVLGRRFT